MYLIQNSVLLILLSLSLFIFDHVFSGDLVCVLWCRSPTPDESLGFTWDPITEDHFRHLALTPSPAMQDDDREKTREFWSSLPLKQNLILHPERVQNIVYVPVEETVKGTQQNQDETTRGQDETTRGQDETTRGQEEPTRGQEEPTRGQEEPTRGQDSPAQTKEQLSIKEDIEELKEAKIPEEEHRGKKDEL